MSDVIKARAIGRDPRGARANWAADELSPAKPGQGKRKVRPAACRQGADCARPGVISRRFRRTVGRGQRPRRWFMTQPAFKTHEVFNQSPPFEDVDLFALDRPLAEAVAANGGKASAEELSEFGQHWGSAAMAARGRARQRKSAKAADCSMRGAIRRDEVEFHPAYHELMARSAHAGIHNSTWTPRANPRAVRRKWSARQNSTWPRRSRPDICARSP